ncbi:hypothetical protein [Paraglaciecola psychrophila]|uniref:Uncharacterized protein n=1 Tax=Paraglaciecola psychrophila 170 TaxID=1129794 RepID=K7A3I2_9ALTE|nr:hypothetical protein [Paraglaciecola psychrophila]AGH43191.1 hypothetical protein C427_1082 [Paraglaciecola psychrophila 170]GAC36932.1 hypothetical protein GPSY_1297 [Paraglaciecola psychrophila 170]
MPSSDTKRLKHSVNLDSEDGEDGEDHAGRAENLKDSRDALIRFY